MKRSFLKYASFLCLVLLIPTVLVWGQATESHKHAQQIMRSYGRANPEKAAQKQLQGSSDANVATM